MANASFVVTHSYHKTSLAYMPHGKEWIKSKVYDILTKHVK